MKKLFILLLVIGFCINTNAQFSKKEMKKIKKREIKTINRGLDLKARFVPYYASGRISDTENAWSNSLFEAGFDVGDYSESNVGVRANGRYLFEIKHYSVTISDLENDNKVVATITFKKGAFMKFNILIHQAKGNFIRSYILEKLIKKNEIRF